MASTYLSRTPGTGQTSRTKGTLSVWLKRAKTDEEDFIFYGFESSANRIKITFLPSGKLQINSVQAGSNHLVYETNRLFRDTNAWYHIVIAIDTTLATAGDRCRLYVNGVEETSFSTETHFSQNDLHFLTEDNRTIYIGSQATGNYYDGCMSHYHLIDGTQYQASDFGETDSTTGEWTIKTSPSVTYGNHGFFILKDGNSVTDSSTNSNNFTVGGGTLTKTEDCPDNVFATMNPLDKNTNVVLENGNTTSYSSANNTWVAANRATLGIAKDKFYWEMKITGSGTANGLFFGVCADTVALITSQGIQDNATEKAKGILLLWDDGQSQLDTNSRASMTPAPAFNDVLGCAVDRDNNTVKFYKNGSEVGSIDISSSPLATCSHIMPFMINYYTNTKFNFNFGNGYFGTTAVSSAGSNASNNGIFEYDVPTGYTALSTKGLNL